MIQWLRSAIYVGLIYVLMIPVGILWLPWMLVDRRGASHACKSWARMCMWLARWMVGIKTEIRGTPPTEECLVAAKHQSFLDAMMIFCAVPRGKYIMKHSLIYAPILGQYVLRLGCIPVKRGQRAKAITDMKRRVAEGNADPGQVMIFPQGTRVAPGAKAPYKPGTAALYEQLEQPCYPVACNVGLFWPRKGIMRNPGTAVVEFLPPIPPGLSNAELMAQIEEQIESASNRLMEEAGFDPDA